MGRPAIDLTGEVYGRLTVLGRAFGRAGTGIHARWNCICTCGNEKIARSADLKASVVQSCGCLARELSAGRATTHGMTNTVEFATWNAMVDRCHNPRYRAFSNYGGRGITVCAEWRDSFETFYADMGKRPTDGARYTLDRIDNSKGYSPDNCRWATYTTQQRNRRSNRLLTFDGRTLPAVAWAEELGIKRSTLYTRLERGWSVERALTPSPSHA